MSGPKARRKKTITRTFRIDEEWDGVLRIEAERQGVSANTLVNQIFHRYSLFDRFADRYEVLTIPQKTFITLLAAATETGLAQAGKNSGSTRPKDGLLMMGRPLNFDSVTWMVTQLYGGAYYGRWFKCDHYVTRSEDAFHLRHNLGRKWSIFVSNYLISMFKSILDIDVRIEILDQTLTFTVEHKTPKV